MPNKCTNCPDRYDCYAGNIDVCTCVTGDQGPGYGQRIYQEGKIMKTVQKNYYVCEICGRTSQKKETIEECWASHRCITDDCEIEQIFDKGKTEPRTLRIKHPDGTDMVFYNNLRQ